MTSRASDGLDLSVVVPTLDEEGEIEETLRRARRAVGERAELLVVDGGSEDRTVDVARVRARVVESEPGRGVQLRRGAELARGEVLLFLHADTWLEPGAGEAIRRALDTGADAGCFRFAVRPVTSSWRYRTLERGIDWRTRHFRTATGDQAIFTTRELYRRCGGIPDLPLFEDVAFVRRLRGHGRFVPLEARAFTSRRRWEERGFWRTVIAHWGLRGAFAAGVDPAALARFYRSRVDRIRG